jgi:ArsR family transcriptional regulator, arsenate/arsenite/antimonite-responsive transcriptional repressor
MAGAVGMTDLRELSAQDTTSPAATCVPIAHTGMSRMEAVATAAVFKALADPARVRVLNLLAASGEPVCVCHLTELLELSQPTVSFHMRRLMDAGLLDREQRGVWAYYSLREDARRRLSAILTFEESNDD